MTEARQVLEVLDTPECRRLLATAVIGRIAFTEAALPVVQPVHFAFWDDTVIVPTRAGGRMAAANHLAVVAFEVDDFDPTMGSGWNVTAVGTSHVTDAPHEVDAFRARGAPAWAPADRPCYIVVRVARLQGRRLRAIPPGGALAGRPLRSSVT